MDVMDNEQTTVPVYEPPALVELGTFGEDTLGNEPYHPDSVHAIGS